MNELENIAHNRAHMYNAILIENVISKHYEKKTKCGIVSKALSEITFCLEMAQIGLREIMAKPSIGLRNTDQQRAW